MAKRRLPIGIQTFRKIREEDCYYVDKTPCIRRLVDEGTHEQRHCGLRGLLRERVLFLLRGVGLNSTDAQSWMNLQDRYELSLA